MGRHRKRRAEPKNQSLASRQERDANLSPDTEISKAHAWGALASVTVVGVLFIALVIVGIKLMSHPGQAPKPAAQGTVNHPEAAVTATTSPTSAPPVQVTAPKTNAIPEMPINQAVMVTVELDFGPVVPGIAAALLEIERRHQPDDGKGRTFAILDAYGEPTSDGKKLHLSMHVSSEKPGLASLVFKRTGEVLWQNRVVMGTNASVAAGKNLLILLDDGAGKTFTVDGSRGPATIMDATLKELGVPIREFWPEEAEREATFIYSACGCPVKAKAKRVGNRTVRTKDMPVMFPDDPDALAFIERLMGWN
jgi:hypothetical protein